MKTDRSLAMALALSLLSTQSGNVLAACRASDMNGSWSLRFRLPDPQQVGTCTFNIGQQNINSGECYNMMTQQTLNFFDGNIRLTRNCQFKAHIILDDGSLNDATGKLQRKTHSGSGSLKIQTFGKVYHATFTISKFLFAQSVR